MASILDVSGVGPALAKPLAACGIKTAEDLAVAELAGLLAVPGIGQTRALSLMAAAKAFAGVAPKEPSKAAQRPEAEQKKKSKKADKAKKSRNSKKKADKKKAKDKKAKPSKTTSGKSKKSKKKKKK